MKDGDTSLNASNENPERGVRNDPPRCHIYCLLIQKMNSPAKTSITPMIRSSIAIKSPPTRSLDLSAKRKFLGQRCRTAALTMRTKASGKARQWSMMISLRRKLAENGWAALRQAGAALEAHTYPDMPHTISPLELQDAASWVIQVVAAKQNGA